MFNFDNPFLTNDDASKIVGTDVNELFVNGGSDLIVLEDSYAPDINTQKVFSIVQHYGDHIIVGMFYTRSGKFEDANLLGYEFVA